MANNTSSLNGFHKETKVSQTRQLREPSFSMNETFRWAVTANVLKRTDSYGHPQICTIFSSSQLQEHTEFNLKTEIETSSFRRPLSSTVWCPYPSNQTWNPNEWTDILPFHDLQVKSQDKYFSRAMHMKTVQNSATERFRGWQTNCRNCHHTKHSNLTRACKRYQNHRLSLEYGKPHARFSSCWSEAVLKHWMVSGPFDKHSFQSTSMASALAFSNHNELI